MKSRLLQDSLGWLALAFLTTHLILTAPSFGKMVVSLIQEPDLSYPEKMKRHWGEQFYAMIEYIQQSTPENSVLLFGPGWFGTPERSMLYPRQLHFGGEETLRAHPEIQFVVLQDNFPNFAVNGEQLLFDQMRGLIKIRR